MKSFTPVKIAIASLTAVGIIFTVGCSEASSKMSDENNSSSQAAAEPLVIDDFSDPVKNSLKIERQFIDDTSGGGQTRTQHKIENGILSAKGEIIPLRGQPGWASIVLLLDSNGLPQDYSAYQGISMLVRVNQGNLSVSANSSEIDNFDYHATSVTQPADGEFHEVKIPFNQMKRAWSAQTTLNTKTLTGLSLVAFGMQAGSFDFEFDEVSFY